MRTDTAQALAFGLSCGVTRARFDGPALIANPLMPIYQP
jgi:hypothetical protein